MNQEPINRLTRYVARRIQRLDAWQLNGWSLKVYGISADGSPVDEIVQSTAHDFLKHQPIWPQDQQHSFGFVTIHVGTEAVWLLTDLWFSDILRHFVFCAALDTPGKFTDGPKDGTTACVWELEITSHERNAWVEHVLMKTENPSFSEYLGDSLEVSVDQ